MAFLELRTLLLRISIPVALCGKLSYFMPHVLIGQTGRVWQEGHAVTMVFNHEKRWHYLANLPTTLQVVQADGGYEVRAAADAA